MTFVELVRRELKRSREIHTPINSLHEGAAIIREEYDEFWDEIKKGFCKTDDPRDREKMLNELVQVSAMCQSTAEDCGLLHPIKNSPTYINTNNLTTENDLRVLYHHPCIDGFTAAWIYHLRGLKGKSTDFIGVNYGKDYKHYLPYSPEEEKNITLILLDFCFPYEQMVKICDSYALVEVYDHHKSSKLILDKLSGRMNCRIHYDIAECGSSLTWRLFCSQVLPVLVRYVQDADLYQNKLLHSREIKAYLDTQDMTFCRWTELEHEIESEFYAVVAAGKAILQFKKKCAQLQWDNRSTIELFEGFPSVPLINVSSQTLITETGQYAFDQLTLGPVIMFYQSRDHVEISLRSQGELDVAKIAEKYGGGGHKNAAGFRMDWCTFKDTFLC